jgi:hypothetical protein
MLSKKTQILVIVLLVITATVLVFVPWYLRYRQQKSAVMPGQLSSNTCPAMITAVIDGTLEQIDGDLLYLIPKDNSEAKIINLASQTEFLELIISPDNNQDAFKENQISRGDFRQGDQLSVVVLYEEGNFKNNSAVAVRRMKVQAQ